MKKEKKSDYFNIHRETICQNLVFIPDKYFQLVRVEPDKRHLCKTHRYDYI